MLKKLAKVFIPCLMSVFIIGSASITVHAESVRETEPNDTIETAETIQANRETAAQAVSGSRPNQYVVNGTTSQNDEDWFKVYLTAGTQYVTCNGGSGSSYDFEVYGPSENLIMRDTYRKTILDVTAYPFTAPVDGYYYVKIVGNTSGASSYILLVGGPTYSVASVDVVLDTVTMANNTNSTSIFDLRFEDILPEDAVVYTISMRSVGTTAVGGITVTNVSSNTSVNLTNYSWNKSGLVSLNMPLRSRWEITYKYNKNISFSPRVSLSYAYPITSTAVEDVVISS